MKQLLQSWLPYVRVLSSINSALKHTPGLLCKDSVAMHAPQSGRQSAATVSSNKAQSGPLPGSFHEVDQAYASFYWMELWLATRARAKQAS